jgi:AcrR family transcriptional regulator
VTGAARQAVDAAPRTRARRGDGPRLRDEILEAATDLLVATGDEGAVSIRAVADQVGVTPPSIYLHFADKDELIFECCRRLMGQLQVEVLAAVDGLVDPVDRLREAARTYVRVGIANPEPYRIMFMSPHHRVPADFDIGDYEGTSAFAVLTEMVAAVGGRPADARSSLTAMGLWAACHGVTAIMIAKAVEPIAFPWPEVDALVDHLLDVHLAAMMASTAIPSRPQRTEM